MDTIWFVVTVLAVILAAVLGYNTGKNVGMHMVLDTVDKFIKGFKSFMEPNDNTKNEKEN